MNKVMMIVQENPNKELLEVRLGETIHLNAEPEKNRVTEIGLKLPELQPGWFELSTRANGSRLSYLEAPGSPGTNLVYVKDKKFNRGRVVGINPCPEMTEERLMQLKEEANNYNIRNGYGDQEVKVLGRR